mgnify:CR=1 FL=1
MIENDPSSLEHFLELGPYKTDRLNVRSVKVYVDGALGSRGALLIDDYSDRRGFKGIIRTPIDSVNNLAFRLAGTKFQMNTHAIGDSTVNILILALLTSNSFSILRLLLTNKSFTSALLLINKLLPISKSLLTLISFTSALF